MGFSRYISSYMNKSSKYVLFLLRVSMGVVFFYAGITKILNPEWSAAGYLGNSSVLPELYAWFANASNIGWVDILNKWGLLLIGISLILGLLVRFSASLGALMMFLYYLPLVTFPYVGDHSYIVDDHVVYIFVLILFATIGAGRFYGFDKIIQDRKR